MSFELEVENIEEWLGSQRPFLISGPCSVESEQQMLETAKALAGNKAITALRGGIWKPRTRPGSFQGVGEKGLKWLKAAGKEMGVPVMTEVATGKHVEQCLEEEIDMLWIGARTSVNPFSVQEIADALEGVDIPVFVKNPINPDIHLWIGALERINRAGIKKLAAIHRGFSTYEKSNYRNVPNWEIPIELKTFFPDLPLFCDPSHISGDTSLLQKVSQKALDLHFDGLMLEAHISPKDALSDAAQQLAPAELKELVEQLVVRKPESQSAVFVNQLEQLRNVIDGIDADWIQKLAERMRVVDEIGEYKRENAVTVLQLQRWKEILESRLPHAESLGLNKEFMRKLLQLIHKESIRLQTEITNSEVATAKTNKS